MLFRSPYDPALPVSTAWDLGVSDHSAIIFYQQLGRSISIIDYHEERGQGLPYYVQLVKDKDYVYKDHFAPHDIEVTDFGNGKTRREVAYQLGIRFKVVPKIPLEDGNQICLLGQKVPANKVGVVGQRPYFLRGAG